MIVMTNTFLKNVILGSFFSFGMMMCSCTDETNILNNPGNEDLEDEITESDDENSTSINSLLTGSTFEERSASLVDHMVKTKITSNSIKYGAPFYYARLLKGENVEEANTKLLEMYNNSDNYKTFATSSGDSNTDFYMHVTIHGYMLTKDKMTDVLKKRIKECLMNGDYCINTTTTVNMLMMRWATSIICCEEWPDFVDKNGKGKDATFIFQRNKARVLRALKLFFTKNHPETDAFTYLPVNLQYVRMLAEFAKDEEIRSAAESTYQQMISQMLLPWNKGKYSANPSRSKGWENLYTGNNSSKSAIGIMSWVYFGGTPERPIVMHTGSDNFGCVNFWLCYDGRTKPMTDFANIESAKTYPYEFETSCREITVSTYQSGDGKQTFDRINSHYTYQSNNYGLSTQHIEAPDDSKYSGFQYTYAFKETKNIHLVWNSDGAASSIFSVCFDNPQRPDKTETVYNAFGYGENPYHRVFGRGKSAIGMYNVPNSYMNEPKYYRMYVPFTKEAIKKRVIREINGLKWVVCHTGSMMFAFATPEQWEFSSLGGFYKFANHDILILTDYNRRRGSYVLETTEIEPYADPNHNIDNEISNFISAIETNTSFVKSDDYEIGDTPKITYTTVDGHKLEMTYLSPETKYMDQYKYDDQTVIPNSEYIVKSDYIEQKFDTETVTLKTTGNTINYIQTVAQQ